MSREWGSSKQKFDKKYVKYGKKLFPQEIELGFS